MSRQTQHEEPRGLRIECDNIPKRSHFNLHYSGEGARSAWKVKVQVLPKHSRKPLIEKDIEIPALEEGADETRRTEQLDYPKEELETDGERGPIIGADGRRLHALTLKVTVRAKVGQVPEGGEKEGQVPEGGDHCVKFWCQTSWDKELKQMPAEYIQKVRKAADRVWQAKKQKTFFGRVPQEMKVALFGRQHHGKSSTINSVNRCMKADTTKPDVAQTAPAGRSATTTLLSHIKVNAFLTVFDLPHIENIAEDKKKLVHLLQHGVADKSPKSQWMHGRYPSGCPDFVILIVSLAAWSGAKEETGEWLHEMQKMLHEEPLANYPYCVAVTHYDEFLKQCQKEDPWHQLQMVLNDIGSYANSSSIYRIANFKTNGAVLDESAKSLKDMFCQAAAFRATLEGAEPDEDDQAGSDCEVGAWGY